jgi:HK97 family phage prohead protease
MNEKNITLKGEGYIQNKISLNLFGTAKIINKKKGERIIAGYANLAVVDSQNQLIPTEVLQAGIETLMADLSYANLMYSHGNIQVGKILPEYEELKTHVDNKGLYIVCEIRNDTKIANEVWEQILDGDINGFSIGCEVTSEPTTKCDVNGENCIEVLNNINIFEVSLTTAPANEMSGFVVVSKSNYEKGDLDLLNYNNVCDSCGIDKDNMTEKNEVKSKVKKEKPEEKTEEETKTEEGTTTEQEKTDEIELSDSERIEKLERDLFNIQALLEKLTGEEEKEKGETKEEKEPEPEKKEKEEKPAKEEEKTEKEPEKKEETKEETKEEPTETEPEETDELKKAVESIGQELANVTEKLNNIFAEKSKDDVEELKVAIKSRDDKIDALEKKIEVLTKSDEKEESKTIDGKDTKDEIEPDIYDDPFVAEKGEVYLSY